MTTLEEKLKTFVHKASPSLSDRTQQEFVREMLLAIDRWALADPDARRREIAQSKQILERVLGLSTRGMKMRLRFSKKIVLDDRSARDKATQYLQVFATTIHRNRKEPHGQMVFRVENIDFTHPKLVDVSCFISGDHLRVSELRHAKGVTKRKREKVAEVHSMGELELFERRPGEESTKSAELTLAS
jgi:hypothetical protein